jgi:choice-of-anchor A domain-containing protein
LKTMQLRNISLSHISVPILLGLSLGFSQKASAANLGLAGNYILFATGNVTQTNSDIDGALAAGGSVNLMYSGVGSSLTTSQKSSIINDDVLVAGGSVKLTNGEFYGNVVYGTSSSSSYSETGAGIEGTVSAGTPIDFSATGDSLVSLSTNLSTLTPIETITNTTQAEEITLTGNNSSLDVFDVSGEALYHANGFAINVPTGATVVVNVSGTNDNGTSDSGTSDTLQNFGFTINGTSAENGTNQEDVLFNFYQATSLTARSITIDGSILAPNAAFSFSDGSVQGNVVVASYSGSGEIEDYPFQGNLPSSVPEPSSFLGSLVAVGFGIALRFRKQFRAR